MCLASNFLRFVPIGVALLATIHGVNAQDQLQAPKGFTLEQATKGLNLDAEAAARVEKLSKDPFRWIILHSKTSRPKVSEVLEPPVQSPDQPRAKASVDKKVTANLSKVLPPARVTANVTQGTSGNKAANLVVASPVITPGLPPGSPLTGTEDKGVGLQVGKVLADIIDFSDVKVKFGGTIEAVSGASVYGRPVIFSARSPNPVVASLSLDREKKMARLEYDVPEGAGSFGGAGIKVDLATDGLDLSQLVRGDITDGLLSIEIDVNVASTLKIILMGPQNRPDAAYPSFRLPVEPGKRTYGLLLADFAAATWALGAPTIAETLKNIMGVGVEYTRSSALSPADRGVFWVGDIQINQAKQIAVAGK